MENENETYTVDETSPVEKFDQSTESALMHPLDYAQKALNLMKEGQAVTDAAAEEPVAQEEQPTADPYRGLRYNEIQDLKRAERLASGEEEVNPIEEEASKALAGGILKTLDSVTSFPERMIDMASGEMEEMGDEYEPDFSFSKHFDIEPIVYNSQWAPFLENIFHYGSLGVGIMGAVAASPFTLPAIGGKITTGLAYGAGVGAVQDAVSINSHEQNTSRWLIEKAPWLEPVLGPLATTDSDSPTAIWLKNIFEGMGFEMFIGGSWELLGQGLSKAKRAKLKGKVKDSALKKLEDRYQQVKEKGQSEFNEKMEFLRRMSDLEQKQLGGEVVDLEGMPPSPYMGIRGASNRPAVDPWQGSAVSRSTPYDNFNNLNKIDADEPMGSVDGLFSSKELEDIATDGILPKYFNRIKKDLISDPRFQELLKKAKARGTSTYSTFKKAFNRYGEITGINFKNPKQDWADFMKRTGMSVDDILTYETIINSTQKVIRDLATAAKEIKKMGGNIFATDGPMKSIADRLVASQEYINYNRVAAQTNVKNANKMRGKIHEEALHGTDLLMKYLDGDAGEELVNEVLNYLSTSHKGHKANSFNEWMRQKIRGGDMLPGKNKQGALLDELHQIHINSFFGPKTAQRAIWGTGFNSYLNQFHDTLGAALRYPITRDTKQFKAQFASLMAMIDFIPDAFKIFKGNLGEAFKSGASIDTRFTTYGRRTFDTEAYKQWLDIEGTESDKIIFNLWETAHNLNGETTLGKAASGVSRVMDAADKTYEELIRHKRVKEIAMREALMAQEKGDVTELTPELIDAAGQLYEQKYYNEFGEIDLKREAFTKNEFDEVTYRTELSGASKAFAEYVNQLPFAKPYFRFVRSGINGLKVKTKGMPFLAGLVKKERDIFFASPEDLSSVRQYGIDNPWDLEKVKARQLSRQAVGMGVVFMGGLAYQSGMLRGNGPNDQGLRNVFKDTGGIPNTLEIGGVRINLDVFEPFDLMLKGIADIGDNMALMGPEWAEDKLTAFAIATAFSEAITDQTYLQSLGDLVDLLRGEPGAASRIGKTLTNFVPFGGWRKWAGEMLTNSYREINSSIWSDTGGILDSGFAQSVRKDNLATEFLAPISGLKPLSLKYNMLNGKPLREDNPLARWWRASSMLAIEPGASPGQKLLWRSNYDLRASVWNSPGPDRISLKDQGFLRSEFSKEMGLVKIRGENLEQWLNRIATSDPRIKASIEEMNRDKRNGESSFNPLKSYHHNRVIKARFDLVRKLAWAKVRQLPEAQDLIEKKMGLEQRQKAKLHKTTHQELLLPTR